MTLITLDLPHPNALRAGWAAFAAITAARGWNDSAYATPTEWVYHDGGGNWAALRFYDDQRAVLIGHDHECSETYFQDAASYFQEEETDLLALAPAWWGHNLSPPPMGEWIGFVYGWDAEGWQRARYDLDDGFESVGLIRAAYKNDPEHIQHLRTYAKDAPGLHGEEPSTEAIQALVSCDAHITAPLLEAVVPGWNIEAGVAAGRAFLDKVWA